MRISPRLGHRTETGVTGPASAFRDTFGGCRKKKEKKKVEM